MKYGSRKYIDLILEASSKWATLEPFSTRIQPGYYGTVDPNSGEFEYQGNIYENPEICQQIPDLKTDAYRPQISGDIDKLIISTKTVQGLDADFGPSVSVAGIAEASVKIQFSFKSGSRGAFLVMYRPRYVDLPKEILLKKLYGLPALKGMFLITGVVTCPAYSLYLSDKNSDSVRLAFIGNLPVVAAPLLSAGGGLQAGWFTENTTGLYQDGINPSGDYKYSPLFTLKQMRSTVHWTVFRDNPLPEPTGDEAWFDALRPWTALNDDGVEDEYYDQISD